jgi:hypothetical protein
MPRIKSLSILFLMPNFQIFAPFNISLHKTRRRVHSVKKASGNDAPQRAYFDALTRDFLSSQLKHKKRGERDVSKKFPSRCRVSKSQYAKRASKRCGDLCEKAAVFCTYKFSVIAAGEYFCSGAEGSACLCGGCLIKITLNSIQSGKMLSVSTLTWTQLINFISKGTKKKSWVFGGSEKFC